MKFTQSLSALVALSTAVLAAPTFTSEDSTAACPQPMIFTPSGGRYGKLLLEGTATYPCGLVTIYANDQVVGVVGAEGEQEQGSALGWNWEDDTLLDGYLEVKVKADGPDSGLEGTYSETKYIMVTA